ncbi:MAG: 3-oxoadipate enol-lactonase [Burkholderiales bacterium]
MKIKMNGIETNYVIEGEGPWLTMSHSLASNLTMWDDQAKLLSSRFKVLRYDTRGHGGSSAPEGPYTMDELADDAKALFDALGIKETHWVGLSMGGMIGETFALKYPGVFKSMVLADTTARRPPNADQMWGERVKIAQEQGMQPLVESTLGRWFTQPFRESRKDVMERIGGHIRSTPVAGFVGCCQAISRIDVLDRLREIKCPALVIVGDQDHGTPPEMARAIQQNLPGSKLVVIPSAAHLSNVEQPKAFDDAIESFLDSVR